MQVYISSKKKYYPCEEVRRNSKSILVRARFKNAERVIKKRYSAILEKK